MANPKENEEINEEPCAEELKAVAGGLSLQSTQNDITQPERVKLNKNSVGNLDMESSEGFTAKIYRLGNKISIDAPRKFNEQ